MHQCGEAGPERLRGQAGSGQHVVINEALQNGGHLQALAVDAISHWDLSITRVSNGRRPPTSVQAMRAGFGDLGVLLGLDPGHADGADHLAVDNDRDATLQ